jgi:xylulose-5-phosphate/fructose-6-phosphate phosphoketolase
MACSYLAAGMIYLKDNPLLKEPLRSEHVKKQAAWTLGDKPRTFLCLWHLNRLINKYALI